MGEDVEAENHSDTWGPHISYKQTFM